MFGTVLWGIGWGTIALAIGEPAWGQTTPAAATNSSPAPAPSAPGTIAPPDSAPIVVTGTRNPDAINQAAPKNAQTVSGETLQKQNLFNFQDLSKVVSGLQMTRNNYNSTSITTIRGVSYNPSSQTTPTASFNFNGAPVPPALIFQSLFDVGQFDVIRGPQGTTGGRASPSGSIGVSTRQPNLQQWGGSFSQSFTDHSGRNVNGALNIPVIKDKLAIRVAGIYDHTDNNGVRSTNNPEKPLLLTEGFRVSVSARPTDNLTAFVSYQNLTIKSLSYGNPMIGNGAAGGAVPSNGDYALDYVQTANANGPVINKGELLTVEDAPDLSRSRQEILSLQAAYAMGDQKLSYIGAMSHFRTLESVTYGDHGNLIDGDWAGRETYSRLRRWTHELHLASSRPVAGLFDYVVGGFYMREAGVNDVINNGTSFLPGAFGSPLGAPIAETPNPRYLSITQAYIPSVTKELSFFGNLNVHVTGKDEIAGGVRFIHAQRESNRVNTTTAAYSAEGGLSPAACAAEGGSYGATYADVCDVPVPAMLTNMVPNDYNKHPIVYNFVADHHFNSDLLLYATYGTSWRPGPSIGGIVNARNDPVLNSLIYLPDETSKALEVGLKSTLFNRRLRLNGSFYHQTFNGLIAQLAGTIPYIADNGVQAIVDQRSGTPASIDGTVTGIDIDVAADITPKLNVRGAFSWARSHFSNQLLPCQDGNFDGIPDLIPVSQVSQFPAGVLIAECRRSGTFSTVAPWNANIRSEYRHTITHRLDATVSGLMTITPRNPNSDPAYVVPGYVLLNLNLGLRDSAAGWEWQVFVKNLTNNRTQTSFPLNDVALGTRPAAYFGNAGYRYTSYVERQEFGLTFRYAFGSR